MTPQYVIFLLVGKLLIYVGQLFYRSCCVKQIYLSPNATQHKKGFFEKLFECDLCLGVWIYGILALGTGINVEVLPYAMLLSELITGCVSSFLMHLLTLGWKAKFEVVVI